MRSRRTQLAIAGDHSSAMFAAAGDRLDWNVVAVAGAGADSVRAGTGAKVVDLDRLIASIKADIVVVGTSPERRCDDARQLLARGVGVVLIPVVDMDVVVHPGSDITPRWVVGDPVPMAPAVQRWLRGLASAASVDRIWITATPALRFSACSVAVLASRIMRWPDASRIAVDLIESDQGDNALPRFEAQAAGAHDALTLSLFPAPVVEHNGSELPLALTRHPADAFGAADLLRTFARDLAAGSHPVLGAGFLDAVHACQENL